MEIILFYGRTIQVSDIFKFIQAGGLMWFAGSSLEEDIGVVKLMFIWATGWVVNGGWTNKSSYFIDSEPLK